MVKEIKKGGIGSYVCEECGLEYSEREWAEKCQRWCSKHHSCNLEITMHKAGSDEETIKKILCESRVIAVVGLSPNEDRPSYMVASYLKEHGYKIIPVNPGHHEIMGEKCYPNLREIPVKVDLVDIFRRPEHILLIGKDAISIGAKVIWMQSGIVNEEAAEEARGAGLTVIMDRCIMMDHARLLKH